MLHQDIIRANEQEKLVVYCLYCAHIYIFHLQKRGGKLRGGIVLIAIGD